ncbi:MAG: hypothetical protein GY909_08750 [Oligoflexia bacterium]|nr:hypothetical protein [Oligoflexia bacterium]
MKVIGFSFGYHDSSVAFIEDGKIKAVVPEERVTRQKHDPNLPINAFRDGMKYLNWTIHDVDKIVLHEDSYNKFSRVLTSSLSGFPSTRLEFVESMKSWLSEKLWAPFNVSNEINFPLEKIEYLGHHFSHSVQGFMGSGFEESAILVIDAVGDWACSGVYRGRWENGHPHVECLEEIAFPNSLGLVYSAITGFLGFSPNDNECSVMALSAFGEPNYYKEISKIIKIKEDGLYEIDTSYFHFINFYSGAVTKKFENIFGKARPFNQKINLSSFEDIKPDSEIKRYIDLACSLQLRIEEAIISLAKYTKEKTGLDNLCLTGGVSLNCVANKKLLEEGLFKNIHIPIEPGDCGTSFGCALYALGQDMELKPEELKYEAYLGLKYDTEKTIEVTEFLKSPQFNDYIMKTAKQHKYELSVEKIENLDELASTIAENLLNDQVIGLYQGNSELGPRALGNRSIIARADKKDVAHKLSFSIKKRASYRPYALSMTEEAGEKILKTNSSIKNYKWMQYSCDLKEEFYEALKYGCHIDKSTRPQVVNQHQNKLYYQILDNMRKEGHEAIINTSFNPSGYPMVEHPSHALAMFVRTDMDILILEDTIIRKEAL